MGVCILLLIVDQVKSVNALFEPYKPVFYLETLCLWAFGTSWLIKGQFLLKDEEKDAEISI
jgi:hypothetical protein